MSQKVDTSEKTFTADGAIPIHSLVRMTATGVDVCGIAHHAIGTATRAAFASGDAIAVKLISGSGTHKVIASAALAQGADAFTAASGKVGATASTAYRIGKCLEAAGADGDVIEVLYLSDGAAAS
jgi:spore maturation protein SpmB